MKPAFRYARAAKIYMLLLTLPTCSAPWKTFADCKLQSMAWWELPGRTGNRACRFCHFVVCEQNFFAGSPRFSLLPGIKALHRRIGDGFAASARLVTSLSWLEDARWSGPEFQNWTIRVDKTTKAIGRNPARVKLIVLGDIDHQAAVGRRCCRLTSDLAAAGGRPYIASKLALFIVEYMPLELKHLDSPHKPARSPSCQSSLFLQDLRSQCRSRGPP